MSYGIKLLAYAERDGLRAFVAVPNEAGRYVLTHSSVLHVACPHCGAMIGEPCFASASVRRLEKSYRAGTHWKRRLTLRQLKERGFVSDKLHASDTKRLKKAQGKRT